MRLISFCLATSLCAFSHAAHADTIQTFNLTDTSSSGRGQWDFFGHMTVDTTTGTIQSFEVGTDDGQIDATTVLYAFAKYPGGGGGGGASSFAVGGGSDASPYFEILAKDTTQNGTVILYLPVASLINYGGSTACYRTCTYSVSAPPPVYVNSGTFTGNFTLEQATPTPSPTPVTATPEPASLYLLGPGLLGLAGLV